jgi:hypothetical protein
MPFPRRSGTKACVADDAQGIPCAIRPDRRAGERLPGLILAGGGLLGGGDITREDVSAAFAKSWRHRFARLAVVLQS